jgi:Transglycosylase SLT domain
VSLSDRFFADLARMGQRRATDPETYLVVWCSESGLDPSAVNASGGARGLNQMMPETLRGLGAPADFEALPAEEQLPWIEKLIAIREHLNGGPFESAARYYHANFFPLTMARGRTPDTIVVAADAPDARERAAYVSNRILDADGDGRITLADLAAVLARVRATRCASAFERLARAVQALPPPGITWGELPAPLPEPIVRRSRNPFAVGAAVALGIAGLAAWRGR